MNNLIASFKRFFSNKNTVTIIGLVAGFLVIFIGYSYRVNKATNPIKIPYAIKTLDERHEITLDDIGYVEVPASSIKKHTNLIRNATQLVGMVVTYGAEIPQGGFFYTDVIVSQAMQPDSAFADIKDGYTMYALKVDLESTYSNTIYPGDYIDLYFKGTDDTRKIIYGPMITSIKVEAVKDNQGNHVFEYTTKEITPDVMLFAVPNDMYALLMKAKYISGVKIEPVPRNANYTAQAGETEVASEDIRNFIGSKSTIIPDLEY